MADLDYDLPASAIAQVPVEPRDAARLLVDRGSACPPEHRHVRDLDSLVGPGDLVVVNDSRVIRARLNLVRPSGGAVEVLLLRPVGEDCWEALVRPGRRLHPGLVLAPACTGDDLRVEVGARVDATGGRLVRLLADDVDAALARHGAVPLPPYIHAPLADPERYQTVYASRPGSAAAPTAGLHLTPGLLARVEAAGAVVARVELQVGLDTFRPVTAEDSDDHVMHGERFTVPPEVLDQCARARRVIAVGTTVVRALESVAGHGASGETRLKISRGHRWQHVDCLLTNFHVPRSTLLLLVDAFVGPRWRTLYATALEAGYRFLSFGDAMLLDRHLP